MKRKRGTVVAGIGLVLILALSACGTPVPTEIPTQEANSAVEPTTEATVQMPTEEATEEAMEPEEESTVSPLPTPTTAATSPIATPEPTADDEMEATEESTVEWVADGIITEGEYSSEADFDDIRIWWHHDGEFLYLAMEADTTGWVAVGINPENRMQGADYIFGYVADGIARLWDAYGTAPVGQHPPDSEIGGTDDIVTFTGDEENGTTRFEVQIPLDSGDEYDQAMEAGNSYPIIVAYGPEDDFDAYHTRYDRGELTLAP